MDILRAVINDMKPLRQDAILLIVANPVGYSDVFRPVYVWAAKGASDWDWDISGHREAKNLVGRGDSGK
jgi:hypothetical protein